MEIETVTVRDKGSEKPALVVSGRTVLVNQISFEESEDESGLEMKIDYDILLGEAEDDLFLSQLGDVILWIVEKNIELGGMKDK